MNGQLPEENLKPESATPTPASFNTQGAGFGAPMPPQSAWSPSSVPPAGPIPSVAPAAPMMEGAPEPINLAASPAPAAPVAPMPAPRPMTPVVPPSVGAGAVVPPPPPSAAQFEVRTMKSDVESMKQSGGGEPLPQSFSPASLGGSEPAFNPTTAPKKGGQGANKIIIIGIVAVGLVGVGILGYMLVKPLLVGPDLTPIVNTPPVEEVLPPVELPPATTPETELVPAAAVHTSLFTLAADKVEERVLPTLTIADIKAAFIPAVGETIADTSIREVVTKVGTASVTFPEFISTLIPDMNSEAIKTVFVPDFTLFVYKDKTADLPGFIAKVDPAATPDALAAFSTSLEASTGLGVFYPEDPGTIGAFKAGSVNSKPIKYAAFSKAGYAFDYGWFKAADGVQYLVVSSSYAGMKEAVRRAGF